MYVSMSCFCMFLIVFIESLLWFMKLCQKWRNETVQSIYIFLKSFYLQKVVHEMYNNMPMKTLREPMRDLLVMLLTGAKSAASNMSIISLWQKYMCCWNCNLCTLPIFYTRLHIRQAAYKPAWVSSSLCSHLMKCICVSTRCSYLCLCINVVSLLYVAADILFINYILHAAFLGA